MRPETGAHDRAHFWFLMLVLLGDTIPAGLFPSAHHHHYLKFPKHYPQRGAAGTSCLSIRW
jgi:hypothetical protein